MTYVQVAIGSINNGPFIQSGGSEENFLTNMVSGQSLRRLSWSHTGKDCWEGHAQEKEQNHRGIKYMVMNGWR